MITIYDINGNPKISVPISDKCVYYKGVMEEEYVNLAFNHHELLQLANGDYIICEHGRFEIVELLLPDDKTASDGGYTFEQHFNPHWWRGRNFKLFYNRQAGLEASWKMTHYAYYFMDIVIDNLRRAGLGEYSYVIDASLSEMKLVSFDGVDIISGLNLIAEAFGTEWWITDNVIHLSRCEYGEPLRLSPDEVKIAREDSADTDYATRLYVFGATRNLPQNYRRDESTDLVVEGVVERRLKLPQGIDHIDAWENLAPQDIVEAIITTDDIYPRRTGTIATITTKQYTDTTENEDGTTTQEKWNAFRFTDTGITFSKEYIIPGEELRITFQSGKLAGLDFAVTFNPDGLSEEDPEAQIWEIVRNEDYGVKLPADNFAPEPLDTYILYGYDTSFVADTLLPLAEQELLDFGKEKIKKLSQDKSNYNCTTNPVRCAGYTMDSNGVMQYNENDVIDLDIGSMVDLSHPVYFPGSSHVGRIRSFEKRLDNRFICTYSVGEAKGYSRSAQLAEQVEALTYQSRQYILSGGGSNIYLIKRQDSTAPSEHNAYSALRARIEFLCRAVAEYVRNRWTFLQGIHIGTFASDSDGASIEPDGSAEINSLKTRGNATIKGNASVGGKMDVTGDVSGANVVAQTLVKSPKIATPDFVANMLSGTGGGIYQLNGMTYAEVDYLTVRNGMSVVELLIQQYRAIGGSFVVSHANGEIESIYDYGNGYNIWIKNEDKAPRFKQGDLVRCEYLDWEKNEKVHYWVAVDVASPNAQGREILTMYKTGLNGAVPKVGDKLVQMGNIFDTNRQGCILITTENSLPRIMVLDGIDKPEIVNTSEKSNYKTILGSLDGFIDPYTGKVLSGYGLWGSNVYLNGEFRLASNGKTIEGALNDVSTQIDNITTGGRNLLVGSSRVMEDRSILVGSYDLTLIAPPRNGETVTLSFSGYLGNGHGMFRIYNSGWSVFLASLTTANYNSERKRYEITFTWKQVDDSNQGSFINIFQYDAQGNRIDAGDYINDNRVASRIYNVLLERAPKASADWFPAPEDFDKSLALYKEEVASQFDVVQGAMTSVQQSVQSLQVGGGRNLLLGTNKGASGWSFWSASIVPYISSHRKGVMFENSNLVAAGAVFRFPLRPELIVVGKQYVLSVDVTLGDMSTDSGQRISLNIIKGNGADPLLEASVGADRSLALGATVHLTFNFTPSISGRENGEQVVYFSIPASNWSSLAFENLKLEEGTVATAYSPAPEDYIDGEIADVRTSITSIVQTTESITARVEEVNTSLNGKITSNTANITANANAITSEVTARSEGDEQLASRISQTADSISMKVSQLGLSNVNHALGTASPWVRRIGFLNKENETYKLYDVTGLASGDVISFSCILRFKGLVWGAGAFISLQLSDTFGYVGLSPRITVDSLTSYSIDADGYYNIKLQGTGITVGKNYSSGDNAIPSDIGYVYIRMDYISPDTDDLGVNQGYISISQMKIEIGENVTPWTARTADLEQAIADTGIDISNRRIIATADNFVVINNNGETTAHVDANGNLSVGAIACRYPDETGDSTPFIADWNRQGDGIQRWYYPDGSIRAEVGWDDATQSFIRKYSNDGDLLWKLGDPSEFQTHSDPIWLTVSLHFCGNDISNVPQSTEALIGTIYYRKTNTGNADTNNVIYKSAIGANPDTIDDGWYTLPGKPSASGGSALPSGITAPKKYSRYAYYYLHGKLQSSTLVTWTAENKII
ncbi:MAG: hypothetical protein J6B30_07175 [Muribaculaceae bacterium]|nr:hypothetical protein [Muribaculaceae bacterium]